ncbi:MAG: class II SORL domain-containing protein [Candidatus Omnitrophica bacterium]|nr:class II SORL domain-containing protein [Candidatus Omnitrophota bacterium]
MSIKDLYQSGDWKAEKHVPVIDAPAKVKKGEVLKFEVSVGKQIAHPNTTAHHISWIEVFFHAEGAKFPVAVGRFNFASHGASTEGADTSTIYTIPNVSVSIKTEKSGKILAASYCNIHGLWESSQAIVVE